MYQLLVKKFANSNNLHTYVYNVYKFLIVLYAYKNVSVKIDIIVTSHFYALHVT